MGRGEGEILKKSEVGGGGAKIARADGGFCGIQLLDGFFGPIGAERIEAAEGLGKFGLVFAAGEKAGFAEERDKVGWFALEDAIVECEVFARSVGLTGAAEKFDELIEDGSVGIRDFSEALDRAGELSLPLVNDRLGDGDLAIGRRNFLRGGEGLFRGGHVAEAQANDTEIGPDGWFVGKLRGKIGEERAGPLVFFDIEGGDADVK